MKFTIESAVLKSAARFVARMSPARPTQPILSGVLVHADAAEGVTFTVYDYERAAQTVADATIDDGGTVLVAARLLQAIADKLPAKPVHLEVDGASLRVKCGASKFTIPLMPAEEYPRVSFDSVLVASMGAVEFEDAASRVVGVASKDDVTPILGAVHVETVGERVVFRATDRYRVAESVAPARTEGDRSILVPATVLAECVKSFTGDIEIRAVDGDNPRAIITGSEGVVSTSVIVGNYPPLGRLLDADRSGSATVDVDALSAAVGRCALVLDREAALKFEFDHLAVTVSGGNDSSVTEEVECDGDTVTVALKPQFVIDGLKSARAESVRVEFTDGGSKPGPVLMHGSRGYRYLLQPNMLTK